MKTIEFLGALVGLVVLILKEWFSRDKRKREEQAKHEEAEKTLEQCAQAALLKLREKAAKESSQAGEAWDQADQDK